MKSLLLDTNALLWFLWADSRLSREAKSQIEDAGNRKRVSIASCWEIAVKVGLQKLDLGESSCTFLPREIAPIILIYCPSALTMQRRSKD